MSYERITERVGEGSVESVRYKYGADKTLGQCLVNILGRLAELEDNIEDGTLLQKICKEGDEVYIIAKQGLNIYSVEKVMIVDFWYSKQDKCLYAIDSDGALHREVYATEQAAEAKIKELKGDI